MEYKNKTKEDAFLRINDAMTGSGIDATKEYYIALRNYLFKWIEKIDAQLYEIEKKRSCSSGRTVYGI